MPDIDAELEDETQRIKEIKDLMIAKVKEVQEMLKEFSTK
jgi:hypothetical protein